MRGGVCICVEGGGVKHVNAYSITVSLSQVIDRDPGLAVSPVWLSPHVPSF